jgi:antitoxin ParD1/3/4
MIMSRQTITFTNPNNEWLKSQVDSEEYSSKSEVVNSLIRQARKQEIEQEEIRAMLIRAESSGFSDLSLEDIKSQAKQKLEKDGFFLSSKD